MTAQELYEYGCRYYQKLNQAAAWSKSTGNGGLIKLLESLRDDWELVVKQLEQNMLDEALKKGG